MEVLSGVGMGVNGREGNDSYVMVDSSANVT